MLSDDSEARWPNTRERIRGTGNFIALNENHPDARRCTARRIDECADAEVTDTTEGKTYLVAVSVLEVQVSLVAGAQERFAENGPPPLDRSAFA